MKKLYIYIPLVAVLAIFAFGCAKEGTVDNNAYKKEFFLAWMEQNHPGVVANADGIYVLEETPGIGTPYSGEDYIYAELTVYDLEGNISSTTSRKLSQQLGTFNESYYYGPILTSVASSSITAGVEAVLKGLGIGATRKAIIPFWLMSYTRYNTEEEYLRNATSSASNVMYEVKMMGYTSDEEKWEIDSLQTHLSRIYKESMDSVSYGLYYKQLVPSETGEPFQADTTIYVNYIGRLLNGQVFDTTIKDTARRYNIYDATKTYGPLKVAWKPQDDASEITLNGNSVIAGFYNTVTRMGPFEKGIGYFISKHGYTSSGSGSTIPAYSPLSFEIEVVEEP